MNSRHRLIRVDSEQRRQKIDFARRMIFEGVNITNRKVVFFLQDESLVPTRVCFFINGNFTAHNISQTECFLRKAIRTRF
jgi:hypothetical protein